MLKIITLLCLCCFTSILSFAALNKGHEIANSIDIAGKGFKGETSEMTMFLIDGDKKVERKMKSFTKEISGDDSKSLLEFLLPKDVAGTKLLTHSFTQKDDKQWIYLPAFRKIKRISSSNKTSSFMGSEFTYEDLRAPSLDKFNYKFLKEQTVAGDTMWTYEKSSKKKSGYARQVITASKKLMSSVKVQFYDRSNSLLKEAVSSDFKSFKVGSKIFWRPNKISMKNVQTLKESELIWKNRKVGAKLKAKVFKKNSLKK
jgi:outer membrane lipoprotein-sorting protein